MRTILNIIENRCNLYQTIYPIYIGVEVYVTHTEREREREREIERERVKKTKPAADWILHHDEYSWIIVASPSLLFWFFLRTCTFIAPSPPHSRWLLTGKRQPSRRWHQAPDSIPVTGIVDPGWMPSSLFIRLGAIKTSSQPSTDEERHLCWLARFGWDRNREIFGNRSSFWNRSRFALTKTWWLQIK